MKPSQCFPLNLKEDRFSSYVLEAWIFLVSEAFPCRHHSVPCSNLVLAPGCSSMLPIWTLSWSATIFFFHIWWRYPHLCLMRPFSQRSFLIMPPPPVVSASVMDKMGNVFHRLMCWNIWCPLSDSILAGCRIFERWASLEKSLWFGSEPWGLVSWLHFLMISDSDRRGNMTCSGIMYTIKICHSYWFYKTLISQ